MLSDNKFIDEVEISTSTDQLYEGICSWVQTIRRLQIGVMLRVNDFFSSHLGVLKLNWLLNEHSSEAVISGDAQESADLIGI